MFKSTCPECGYQDNRNEHSTCRYCSAAIPSDGDTWHFARGRAPQMPHSRIETIFRSMCKSRGHTILNVVLVVGAIIVLGVVAAKWVKHEAAAEQARRDDWATGRCREHPIDNSVQRSVCRNVKHKLVIREGVPLCLCQ